MRPHEIGEKVIFNRGNVPTDPMSKYNGELCEVVDREGIGFQYDYTLCCLDKFKGKIMKASDLFVDDIEEYNNLISLTKK